MSSSTQPPEEILTERREGLLLIQFNRPSRKNALTLGMYDTVANLLNAAAQDGSVRVVLLHGAGDSYSAGNDLQDFLENPPRPDGSPQQRFVTAFIDFDKPIVAAVHGAAIGSGTTMLTHCDFVYAAENTRFQMPFVNLAVVPELATSYLIPNQIGYIPAAEMFLLGTPFNAGRALELGLVTRVVADPLSTAMDTALALAEKPMGALQATKRLLKRWSRESTRTAVKVEVEEFSIRVRSAEAREAINAFLQKRRPDFAHLK